MMRNGFAVPVGGMKVPFISHRGQIPANALTLVHDQSRQVGEDVSVQRMVESLFAIPGLFALLQLVKDPEKNNELFVDVNRASILFSASARSHNDWSDQAAIRLHRLVDVTVIKPQTRTFSRRWPTAGIGQPMVGELATGRHGNARHVT